MYIYVLSNGYNAVFYALGVLLLSIVVYVNVIAIKTQFYVSVYNSQMLIKDLYPDFDELNSTKTMHTYNNCKYTDQQHLNL